MPVVITSQSPGIHVLSAALGVAPGDVVQALKMAFPEKQAAAQPPLLDRICQAYEDGYAHGLEDDAVENPHAAGSVECQAWAIGRGVGIDAFNSVRVDDGGVRG